MTLQVALVGVGGIVLASDTKFSATATYRHAFQSTKIRIDRKRGMAVAHARNDLGIFAAKNILRHITEDDLALPIIPLERIADKTFRQARRHPSYRVLDEGMVLVVLSRDLSTVYRLSVARNSVCHAIKDKAIAGDDANAGLFFAEHYYQELPIKDLAFLAAHTILMGSEVHPSGVCGLEMLFCRPDGFVLAPPDQIDEYVKRSQRLDREIRQALIPQSLTRLER